MTRLLFACALAALCLTGAEEAPRAIVLDVSLKHAHKIREDLVPYISGSQYIVMSMNQTGGAHKTRRRIERLMRFNNASLVLPFAMFKPKTDTQMEKSLEIARAPGSFEQQMCDTLPTDPLLLARTYASAGNYHELTYLPRLCALLGRPHVMQINLVGSCVIDASEKRFMREESGTEEYHSVRDAQRPRPDLLVCVSHRIKPLDTSPAAVLAGIFYQRAMTGVVSCTHLWSGLHPNSAVSDMVHPNCGGFSDPTGVPVIDVNIVS